MANTDRRKNILTMRYATQFKCIGGDCPDDCCHDWDIQIDKKTYQNLKKLYQGLLMAQNSSSKESSE
ncbi:hypothetical protein [Solemya velesiana gill symbiont]|uniref:Zinc/iron-chelating domain-containing protein n=1 Tax=Solemya velesiana gill symbiont TaxID=1918948 RepID=A0A1T2KY28_9GAMM|nr:hypothetical protein [Solemya velesiana gill symbiont]OOZ37733.1 hypothetical protein BOW51_00955 [Solemya velesiana gill symbiont]